MAAVMCDLWLSSWTFCLLNLGVFLPVFFSSCSCMVWCAEYLAWHDFCLCDVRARPVLLQSYLAICAHLISECLSVQLCSPCCFVDRH